MTTEYTVSTFPVSTCPDGGGCGTCIAMCRNTPGWATPEEVRALIAQGHAERLMLNWWVGESGDTDTEVLCPAIIGYEGCRAPWGPYGSCSFLGADGLCAIHNSGAKPLECRAADCQHAERSEDSIECRPLIVTEWKTAKAKALIREWKRAVDYDRRRAPVEDAVAQVLRSIGL